jgi:hypothetical protein
MRRDVSMYAMPSLDGVLVCPALPALARGKRSGPDSRKRIFLGGFGPDLLRTLSPLQIQAVVDLALREPGAHKNYDRVIFYDARYWAKTEPGRHRKLQIRVL